MKIRLFDKIKQFISYLSKLLMGSSYGIYVEKIISYESTFTCKKKNIAKTVKFSLRNFGEEDKGRI